MAVRDIRMSPVGVQICEIGAFTQDNNTASLALSSVVLNVESGSTLFRMILFAFSLRNECDWERISFEVRVLVHIRVR
jgi:hypothetical protein